MSDRVIFSLKPKKVRERKYLRYEVIGTEPSYVQNHASRFSAYADAISQRFFRIDNSVSVSVIDRGKKKKSRVEQEEPEWPDPIDSELHVYKGVDGSLFVYIPANKKDKFPWIVVGSDETFSRLEIASKYKDSLPLTELTLS